MGSSFGVYSTFDEARLAIPKNRRVGYDQPAMAAMYRERIARVYAADYPVVYWLSRAMTSARRLFDFGGHVGIQYYSFRPYVDDFARLEWMVCDLPEVIKAGRDLATERKAAGLTFTDRFADVDGADVFLASGSLQFLEAGFLPSALAQVTRRPPHLVINKTPVHERKEFVTVHDNGPACHPYTVFQRDRLVSSLEELGYQLVDRWDNPELTLQVPCFPEYDVAAYSGFYFRARA
jgi:putative methyltransferase (TIGR04325 family)